MSNLSIAIIAGLVGSVATKEPNWFSGLPGIKAFCGNRQCCLIGLDRQLAASWKRGNRHLTIVGAKDIGEVNTIVSWLDENGDSTG